MRRLLQIVTVHSFTYSFKFTYNYFVRLAVMNDTNSIKSRAGF